MRRLVLPLLLLLFFFFLLTSGSFPPGKTNILDVREICILSKACKSQCCRRTPDSCESHCAEKGSEGSVCHTQMFFGLYRECPCGPSLTCVFPKNEKSFRVIIYGRCQKTENKKPTKRMLF
ncbi:colipase-like protein 1 [Carlito syrichta]|uniref:Colipase-like protein 1 n=1 Tax=Carlito syrichta TaxID=1868482 RepID=A0A1U7TGT9_CARSF|nr:colipase-like protein 1 [Carlito syrichta]